MSDTYALVARGIGKSFAAAKGGREVRALDEV
jgi:hypothetical protein